MGLKLGLSHEGKNTDRRCLRAGCLEECLDLTGKKWRKAGMMRSFIPCMLHQIILLGWSNQGGWDGRGT